MSSAGDDGVVRTVGFPLGTDEKGRSVVAFPYDRDAMADSVMEGLASKSIAEADAVTEDPDVEDGEVMSEGGPIRRWNDVFTDLGSVQLEQVAMDGHEIANATATLRNEMYRNKFPLVLPRFTVKCRDEECGAEYDEDVAFCLQCAREEMEGEGVETPPTDPAEIPEGFRDHPVRYPNPSQKREAARMAESVNKEGQSLRDLFKELEDDQSRLGVSMLVVKHKYWLASGDSGIYRRGEVINERPDELLRGDPKHIVPVVDENGRVGNYWYTCPVHREEARTKHENYLNGERRCGECGADLREVRYVEQPYSRSGRGSKPEKYYFENEVITWSRYFPRLHGLDGLSPVHHIWVKQAILHWMDIYGAAYFDPQSDRLPHKFLVVHTTNPDAWERNFKQARTESKENPYDNKVFMNEFSSESRSTPEVQVIDLMSDNLIGQDEQMRDRYKQDIRTQFGVTNIFDSELKDAGGLNNEGLQLEVTDRSVATAMLDTEQGPLDELSKTLDITDYFFGFVPPEEADVEDLRANIAAGMDAAQAGLDSRLEDHKVQVDDGDFEQEEGGAGGGLAGLFGAAEDGGSPPVDEKFDPMVNGHQLDPETGEGVCENTGETIEAETLRDIAGDCPHCGQRMAAVGEKEDDGDGGGRGETPEPYAETDGTERTPSEKREEREAGEKASPPEGEEGKAGGGRWEPYRGPQGGEGWKHQDTGEVRYQKEPPGNVDPLSDAVDDAVGAVGDPALASQASAALASLDPDRQVQLSRWAARASASAVRALVKALGEYGPGLADAALSMMGEEGYPAADYKADPRYAQLKRLDDAFEHIVWADETNKAEPFWDDDESVPQFVVDLVLDAVERSVYGDIESLPRRAMERLERIFKRKMTQPQGWSLSSISEDISTAFDIPAEDAELVTRTETASILNNAREDGYRELGIEDSLFRWIGPHDHRTTDACEWLKEVTDRGPGPMVAEHGRPRSVDTVGEPVTLDELIALEQEATRKFFPHLDFRKHVVHPNERHSFVETFKAVLRDDVFGDADARGPVEYEVDFKLDMAPAMGGTFAAA